MRERLGLDTCAILRLLINQLPKEVSARILKEEKTIVLADSAIGETFGRIPTFIKSNIELFLQVGFSREQTAQLETLIQNKLIQLLDSKETHYSYIQKDKCDSFLESKISIRRLFDRMIESTYYLENVDLIITSDLHIQ